MVGFRPGDEAEVVVVFVRKLAQGAGRGVQEVDHVVPDAPRAVRGEYLAEQRVRQGVRGVEGVHHRPLLAGKPAGGTPAPFLHHHHGRAVGVPDERFGELLHLAGARRAHPERAAPQAEGESELPEPPGELFRAARKQLPVPLQPPSGSHVGDVPEADPDVVDAEPGQALPEGPAVPQEDLLVTFRGERVRPCPAEPPDGRVFPVTGSRGDGGGIGPGFEQGVGVVASHHDQGFRLGARAGREDPAREVGARLDPREAPRPVERMGDRGQGPAERRESHQHRGALAPVVPKNVHLALGRAFGIRKRTHVAEGLPVVEGQADDVLPHRPHGDRARSVEEPHLPQSARAVAGVREPAAHRDASGVARPP